MRTPDEMLAYIEHGHMCVNNIRTFIMCLLFGALLFRSEQQLHEGCQLYLHTT
jgi:hypothetical protein